MAENFEIDDEGDEDIATDIETLATGSDPEPERGKESVDEELLSYSSSSIIINITLLPEEAAGERKVILSAGNIGDPPISRLLEEKDLLPLAPAITDLLNELKADFPNRQTHRKVRAAKQQRNRERPNTTGTSDAFLATDKVPEKPNPGKQLTLW